MEKFGCIEMVLIRKERAIAFNLLHSSLFFQRIHPALMPMELMGFRSLRARYILRLVSTFPPRRR